MGDTLCFADELELDNTYELRPGARMHRLSIKTAVDGSFTIAADSAVGHPGATLHLDCCLTMMTSTGHTTEILVLVEVDAHGHVANVHALPLARLSPCIGYILVSIERKTARQKFAQVACGSFSRGTHITMASGAQTPVEELAVGDIVLTRDDGPQPVRWIGQSTVRAVGEFAPVRIRAGVLQNENDLLVRPDHRLFIYQHFDAHGAGRHEAVVRARQLVNGETVLRQPGGFIDYFQLLLDRHYIIFAEGIAAETFLVDTRTRDALPRDLDAALMRNLEENGDRRHLEYEVSETLLHHPDPAGILKHASTC